MEDDKNLHYCACTIVAVCISLVMLCIGAGALESCAAGFMGSVACGLGKEYGDSKAPGNKWDWKDILYDVYGAASGCLVGTLKICF